MAGGDLSSHLDNHHGRYLTSGEACRLAGQIAGALEHAHGRNIVHRDVKPGNIWLDDEGQALLGDFGLAFAVDRTRLTQEGVMVGTASYMPPEQALGQPPDARSDLYALGATLYEMITGRPPFVGDDTVAVISQHINTRPVAPSLLAPGVPPPLESLVLELLAKDPTMRPAGASQVRQRLEQMEELLTTEGAAAPGAPAVNPLDRLSSGVFVGREREVERGRALVDEAFSGRPRVMLLVGEPGIGKTRIAEELTTYARMRGAQVYWGRCHEGDGAPPFWPWVQIVRAYAQAHSPDQLKRDFGLGAPAIAGLVSEVRQVLPDLPEAPPADPEQARFRLFDAMVSFLRTAAERAPVVLVLDDLHWADRPSLVLCEFLARELGPSRLLVVATYRDVELRRQHPLSETLAELTRLQVGERVLLRGISQVEVGRFIEQSANLVPRESLVEAIHRETEGNLFFVHEVVRLLVADGRLAAAAADGDDGDTERSGSWSLEIPQGVREVVGRRLNRLSDGCNDLLLVASVLGREFTLPVVERVSDRSREEMLEAIEEALAARVISEVPGPTPTYRFSHALMRETLYEELSTPRRVSLHRNAGEALQALWGDQAGSHLAEIAHHFYQAVQSGGLDRAVEALVRAAEWAGERQAFEEEAQHYEQAIQVLEMDGSEGGQPIGELLVRLSNACAHSREIERSRSAALSAIELARRAGLPELLARAALAYGQGFLVIEMGRVDRTMVELLEEAQAGLQDSADRSSRELEARVGLRLGVELYFGGDRDRVDRLLAEAGAIVAELDDPSLRLEHLSSEILNLSSDRFHLVEAPAELASEARRRGDIQLESKGLQMQAYFALFNGDRAAFDQVLAREEQLITKTRLPLVLAIPAFRRAALAVLEGRWQDMRPHLARGGSLFSGGTDSNARQWTGSVLYIAGRHLGRLRVTEESLGFVARFPNYPVYRAFLAAIQAAVGELEAARANLEILADDGFGRRWRDHNRPTTLALTADTIHLVGDVDRAIALFEEILPWSGRHAVSPGTTLYLGSFDQRLGMLAAMQGDHVLAIRHLLAAAESCRRLGARPFEVESRLHLVRSLLAAGPGHDPEAARGEAQSALAIARELEMAPSIAAAEELLAAR